MYAARRWTREDDERLLELMASGKLPIQIGKELGRSTPAIIQRIALLKKREELRRLTEHY